MKKLILGISFMLFNYLCTSQNANSHKPDRIDKTKITGTYFLNDTVNNLSVRLIIKNYNKFINVKLTKDTKTVSKGSWKITNDTLTLYNIKTEQTPKPKETKVFSNYEIKIVFINNKLSIVSVDGKPTSGIYLEREY